MQLRTKEHLEGKGNRMKINRMQRTAMAAIMMVMMMVMVVAVNAQSEEDVVTGKEPGDFEYFDLTMYWSATICGGNYTNGSFISEDVSLCTANSRFTYPLSLLSLAPRDSNEYCKTEMGDFSSCAKNAGMSESECEENMADSDDDMLCGNKCFIPEDTVKKMNRTTQWGQYAPAWTAPWDENNVGNLVWMTYGSCSGLEPTEFAKAGVDVAKLVVNGPGLIFGKNWGGEVNMSELEETFPNNTATFGCTKDCEIATVNLCLQRNEDGTPGYAVPCPEGDTRTGLLSSGMIDDCSSCDTIIVPQYPGLNISGQIKEEINEGWNNFQVLVSNTTQQLNSTWSQLQEQFANATQDIGQQFQNITSLSDFGDAAKGAFGDVKDIANNVGNVVKEGFNEVKDGISNIFGG